MGSTRSLAAGVPLAEASANSLPLWRKGHFALPPARHAARLTLLDMRMWNIPNSARAGNSPSESINNRGERAPSPQNVPCNDGAMPQRTAVAHSAPLSYDLTIGGSLKLARGGHWARHFSNRHQRYRNAITPGSR